ncbi:AIPR family protein [Leptospira sp. 2 VSF19]|uniref:AIPR family protein n=1 Tax=Leptospira soteropolitanensis TaxID=2950025 RepID=A0AAW5VLH1_9LEPT|nr:AIPR family protein [Leptospira soteropolitanensis]MCW7494811.1 AIPR family protein [Leptospira soteropolitanensis]MCW7502391.1 AIPR family protein [Leptospira soteropolitanensis]MCW7524638.1 AIPR family protein [Leptospira soteropolitanensis]MCW7528509.1 AIPR family protein [Leptospira soteropolitanensis]MCW7532356.1 AIPR family protein [Leptospira soteropolitanensis]
MANIQNFSLINTYVSKTQKDFSLKSKSSAFSHFALDLLLNLQPDEIHESITDTNFLKERNFPSGHDRGIDAVYIQSNSGETTIIHFFNFKYTENFEKTQNHFPSTEIDKIVNFLTDLFAKDPKLIDDVNISLGNKIEEIWEIFESENPVFVVHILSNHYHTFEINEKKRFERSINQHSNFGIKYYTLTDLVQIVSKSSHKEINCKLRAIGKNFFEKSDGDIRALIVNLDARDVIRIVSSSEDLREDGGIENYELLKTTEIEEQAFEDNVRIYLKQRSKINKNIKQTALSNENHQFFYFNNGLTFTCDSFTYNKSIHSPIIEIKNLQVVNGSQTIHALYEAFLEDSEKVGNIDLLCRIYQTQSEKLSNKIAEYTNSQNPVNSRDIRSIDYVQIIIEKECIQRDYYYERKKGMYSDKPRSKRLDAEKVGQILMSLVNGLPSEAKNDKKSIFAEKYDEIFNESLNAELVITGYKIFDFIEEEKEKEINTKKFLSYCSYWILFLIGEIAKYKNVTITIQNLSILETFYPIAVKIIEKLRKVEIDYFSKQTSKYSDITFFKYNRPKKHFEELTEEDKKKLMG